MKMYLSKTLPVLVSFIVMMSAASVSFAKEPLLDMRGACVTGAEIQALIKIKAKKMKSGETLKLIIDTPNGAEAENAIKQERHTIVEKTKDKDKDSTTYILRINK